MTRPLQPAEALERIAACMSGGEWSADTADAVAGILRDAGHVVADVDEAAEDEQPTCPTCGPGETLEGQYMVDASEERGEYDGWLCSRCRGYWTVAELDATSGYRQAFIEGDAVAERIRLASSAIAGAIIEATSEPAPIDLFASGAKLLILLDGLVSFAGLHDTMLSPADARRGAAYCRRQAREEDTRAFFEAAAELLDKVGASS